MFVHRLATLTRTCSEVGCICQLCENLLFPRGDGGGSSLFRNPRGWGVLPPPRGLARVPGPGGPLCTANGKNRQDRTLAFLRLLDMSSRYLVALPGGRLDLQPVRVPKSPPGCSRALHMAGWRSLCGDQPQNWRATNPRTGGRLTRELAGDYPEN